jgi:hypothetical protein
MSLLDRVKIQAEILVPLVRSLEAELGREEAHRIVGGALREHFQAQARARWDAVGHDLPVFMREWSARSGTKEALTTTFLRVDEEHIDFDVTDCQYARFWHELGAPDIGFLLQCSADFAVDGAVDPLHLRRTQTRMQGASHCDFRFTIDRTTEVESA